MNTNEPLNPKTATADDFAKAWTDYCNKPDKSTIGFKPCGCLKGRLTRCPYHGEPRDARQTWIYAPVLESPVAVAYYNEGQRANYGMPLCLRLDYVKRLWHTKGTSLAAKLRWSIRHLAGKGFTAEVVLYGGS